MQEKKQYAHTCMYLPWCTNHRVSILTLEEKLSEKSGNCKSTAVLLRLIFVALKTSKYYAKTSVHMQYVHTDNV